MPANIPLPPPPLLLVPPPLSHLPAAAAAAAPCDAAAAVELRRCSPPNDRLFAKVRTTSRESVRRRVPQHPEWRGGRRSCKSAREQKFRVGAGRRQRRPRALESPPRATARAAAPRLERPGSRAAALGIGAAGDRARCCRGDTLSRFLLVAPAAQDRAAGGEAPGRTPHGNRAPLPPTRADCDCHAELVVQPCPARHASAHMYGPGGAGAPPRPRVQTIDERLGLSPCSHGQLATGAIARPIARALRHRAALRS